MPAFQAVNQSYASQFITNSCKECPCVDFQVSPNRYQGRDHYISDDDQICWGCKHKALGHRWDRGEIDYPTYTNFVGDGDKSDPYEGPLNSSPLGDLQARRIKSEKDATPQKVESEYDHNAEESWSPVRPIGTLVPRISTPKHSTITSGYGSAIAKATDDWGDVAESPAPKPAASERREATNWEGAFEGSHQRPPAVKMRPAQNSDDDQVEFAWQEKPSAVLENAPPSSRKKNPEGTPTEPKVPTGRLTLSGIMEYLVLRNQYDAWERRNSDANIQSALSKIQEDLACVKDKLGSVLDDDFASEAIGALGTPYNNAQRKLWDHSETHRMARSPGPSPRSSPPALRPNTEPRREISEPFIKEFRASSAPTLRYWRDKSNHAASQNVTSQGIGAAPPSQGSGRTTAVSPINPVGMTLLPQTAKKGGIVIREEIDEDYDSCASGETEMDDETLESLRRHRKASSAGSDARKPLGSKRLGSAPASQNNSANPEDSQEHRESIGSDGYVPFPKDGNEFLEDDSDSDLKLNAQRDRRDNGKSVGRNPSDTDAAGYASSRHQQTQGVGEEEDGSSSPYNSLTEEGAPTQIVHMHGGILLPPLSPIAEESPTKPFKVYMDPIGERQPLEIPRLAPPLTAPQSALPGKDSGKSLSTQFAESEDEDYSDLGGDDIDEQESTTSEYLDQTPPRKSPRTNQHSHSATDLAGMTLRRSPRKLSQAAQYPHTLPAKRVRESDELEIEAPRKRAKTKEKSPSKPPAAKKVGPPKLARAKGRKKAKTGLTPSGQDELSSGDDHHPELTKIKVPTRPTKIALKLRSEAPRSANPKRIAKKSAMPVGAKYKKAAARNSSYQPGELGELEIGELYELNYM